MKIQIIGFSGSGKSTLAKQLSSIYNLPILFLDTINFTKDWVKRDKDDIQKDFIFFYENNPNWIIEGNNFLRYEQRFVECDQLIFLNINRLKCLKNVFKRHKYYKKHPNLNRFDAPNFDKLTPSFLWWLLFSCRGRKYKKIIYDLKNKYHDKFIEFKNQKEIDLYLKQLN